MTQIKNAIQRQNADDIIGIKVIAFDTNNNELTNIILSDEEELNRLQNFLNTHTHDYITINTFNSEEFRSNISAYMNEISIEYNFPRFYLEENGNLYMEYKIGD